MSTERLPLSPLVRPLNPSDLDRIMEIELAAYPFPWTRGIFADCLRVGYDCTGLQVGSTLVGYVVQTQAAGECHLLNLCIDPAWQGRRLGSLLLSHALKVAALANCNSMFLEVRRSNTAAIALYRKRGFEIVGERPDYYRAEHGRECAVVMRIEINPAANRAAQPPRHDPF